jgi:hypothetical protein
MKPVLAAVLTVLARMLPTGPAVRVERWIERLER